MAALLYALLVWTGGATGKDLELPVFVSKQSTKDFFYTMDILENMTEFTMCMWLSLDSGSTTSGRTLVSYATKANDNEIWLTFGGSNRLSLYTTKLRSSVSMTISSAQKKNMEGWRKHCFLWTNEQTIEWYVDFGVGFVLLANRTWTATTHIEGGGALILFQDQDTYFSSFQLNQIAMAKVGWFNMWRKKLPVTELNNVGCWDKGDVVHMNSFLPYGEPVLAKELLSCKDSDKAPLLDKTSGLRRQAMTFCTVQRRRLVDHVLSVSIASRSSECLLLCLARWDCLSVNFLAESGTCELNSATDLPFPEHFLLSENSAHFTHREC